MDKFIYTGSGLGAPKKFLFIKEGEQKAKPIDLECEKLSFVTSTNNKYTGVVAKDKEAKICAITIDNDKESIEEIATVETGAVYYPILSKCETKIAYIETPDKNYPPQNETLGIIRVLEKKGDKWVDVNFQAETFIDPIDWANDEELLYPNKDGNLVKINVLNGKKPEKLADNVFYPVISNDGKKIAFYDGKHLCVLKNNNLEKIKIPEDAQFLNWSKDDEKLIYVYKSGMWKMSANKLNLETKENSSFFETAQVEFIKEL